LTDVYICDLCGNVFSTMNAKRMHEKWHTGVRIVRKIQSRYYPVKTRSLLRQIDSVDKNGDYKPHPSKQNWKKYKKGQDIKKGKQAVLVWKLSQEMTHD
jgi:hypothetical protein